MNKRTREALEKERIAQQAQDEVNKAARKNVKLAKDRLEDYVDAFHAIAAVYQNRIAAALQAGREPDPKDMAAFAKWGGHVVDAANKLADYQSPKFKSIQTMTPPPTPAAPAVDPDNVTKIDDPIAAARVYARLVKRVG